MYRMKKPSPAIISIIVIALLAVGTGAVYFATREPETTTVETTQSETTTETPSTESSNEATDSTYANGSYNATGSYSTPGGSETIDITVTLADGVVTAVSAKGSATSGNSKQYQQQFLSGFAAQVEGKQIDSVKLSRVAGSSLTSNGFNRAIEIIKNDARG